MASSRKRPPEPDIVTKAGTRTLLQCEASHLKPTDRLVLQVTYIHRYALDEDFFAASGETVRPLCGDAFDVTLCDGVNTLRCVLSTALNGLVYRGWLRQFALVRVLGWRKRQPPSPTGEAQPPSVILTELAAASANVPQSPDVPPKAWPDVTPGVYARDDEPTHLLEDPTVVTRPLDPDSSHLTMKPLLGRRRHYLRLESDEVFHTPQWARYNDEQLHAPDFPAAFERLREADFPPLSRAARPEE
eukprot:1649349-Prymnesium_polylepis.1